jgi:AraC-like DNA-binding protein
LNKALRFSTADCTADHSFAAWRQRLEENIGPLVAEPLGKGGFHAELEEVQIGQVRLFRIYADAHSIERLERAQCAQGMIHLLFPLQGRLCVEQNGRRANLAPGDWGFYDTGRAFTCSNDAPVRLLLVAAPRNLVFGRDISAYRCTAERLSAGQGAAMVVRSYLVSLLDALPSLSPVSEADLAATAVQLVRLMVSEALRQRSLMSVRDMLRARIEIFVSRNLRDPDLTVDKIAAAHDCTKRYVHKIFSGQETLGQYILHARLDCCWEDLRKPDLSHRSITEIAFSWGFNSSAHFSRVFRRRFGISPSACRTPSPAACAANRWALPRGGSDLAVAP